MNDRAVSMTVSYVLALGITTLLASGLILAGGEFVSEQRERAIWTELQVVGEQLAGDLERADRTVTASSSGPDTLTITRRLPESVSGEDYVVELLDRQNATLQLRTDNPDVTITVPIHNRTAVDYNVVTGGVVEISYNPGGDVIEVNDG